MDYYLGVDGGGTKTTALVCDAAGRDVIAVTGDSINYRSEGMTAARAHLRDILSEIERQTGIDGFRGACIGSSALFGPATEEETRVFTEGLLRAERLHMDSDLFIALKACGTSNAIAAICGTGSMAAAFDGGGNVVTRGGFGYLFGDEGSGYAIAREALFIAAKDVYAFTSLAYDPPLPRKRLASFAPCVTRCAEQGDPAAIEVLHRQADLFADTVRSLAAVLPERPKVFLYGGVFAHDPLFTARFKARIAGCCGTCEMLPTSPVKGAVLAAMAL